MTKKHLTYCGIFFACLVSIYISCAPVQSPHNDENMGYIKPSKTINAYLQAGRWWGRKHWTQIPRLRPGEIDPKFVEALVDRNNLDFFWINTDLKDAFKKGYRRGYEDRTADLVLGPHFEKAAIVIGNTISTKFVNVIETFETDWIVTLRRAIDVFIVLIAEGSQADREGFINEFTRIYSRKYSITQALLKAGGFMQQMSEGGTALYIDMTKVKAVLDIPSPKALKTEIYHQTFKVMGDEMGRRYSHNLIRRDDLIDWLRRSKTALSEVPGNNLGIIFAAFIKSYGTDARNVFEDLARGAGYKRRLTPAKNSKGGYRFKPRRRK